MREGQHLPPWAGVSARIVGMLLTGEEECFREGAGGVRRSQLGWYPSPGPARGLKERGWGLSCNPRKCDSGRNFLEDSTAQLEDPSFVPSLCPIAKSCGSPRTSMLARAAPAGSFPPPPLTLGDLVWVERNHSAKGHPVGRPLFILMEAAFLPCSTG